MKLESGQFYAEKNLATAEDLNTFKDFYPEH